MGNCNSSAVEKSKKRTEQQPVAPVNSTVSNVHETNADTSDNTAVLSPEQSNSTTIFHAPEHQQACPRLKNPLTGRSNPKPKPKSPPKFFSSVDTPPLSIKRRQETDSSSLGSPLSPGSSRDSLGSPGVQRRNRMVTFVPSLEEEAQKECSELSRRFESSC